MHISGAFDENVTVIKCPLEAKLQTTFFTYLG
jgi:hypothetical protein